MDRTTLRDDLEGRLWLWVVYYNPSDFPGLWVIRRQGWADGEILKESSLWAEGMTLESVRKTLPAGLTRLDRHDEDDPVIWEVWI